MIRTCVGGAVWAFAGPIKPKTTRVVAPKTASEAAAVLIRVNIVFAPEFLTF
jgi:hypothetical protein